MKASELGLVGVTAKVAADFELAFPDAVFTSGRRSILPQAHAMAGNVVRNRQWIAETYVHSAASAACQAWVDANLGASLAETADGLLGVLQGLTPEELEQLTHHLVGHAFDVQPDGDAEKLLWLAMRAEKEKGKFIEKEGGLDRWHWQAP